MSATLFTAGGNTPIPGPFPIEREGTFLSAAMRGLVPAAEEEKSNGPVAAFEYEPDEEDILAALLPRNIAVQLFRAFQENAASEQGSRMTAMDNATRNAGDMIKRLTIQYNRSRQAAITTELVEIISGAEALKG